MWIVLSDYVRYLNHIRYTVSQTDNHHGGTRQNHLGLLYIQHEGGRHIDFRQMSISQGETTANNCKTAFSLHVVESASDDYNF